MSPTKTTNQQEGQQLLGKHVSISSTQFQKNTVTCASPDFLLSQSRTDEASHNHQQLDSVYLKKYKKVKHKAKQLLKERREEAQLHEKLIEKNEMLQIHLDKTAQCA